MSAPVPGDVARAAEELPAELRGTPCVPSAWLSEICARPVWLKLESLQPTHSFKVRGAFTALNRLGGGRAVVTASAGNHGAALAWAAARLGAPLTVFTPRDAPRAKLVRIASLGATLRAEAEDYDDAERRAREFATRHGVSFISPYNDPDVVAGAGTIGLEILSQVPSVDEIVVPLGGGGLASGVALAVSAQRPKPRIVAAEPAESPAFTTALAAGRITPIVVGDTIADGLAGNLEPGSITFELVRSHVDVVVAVDDASVRGAVAQLMREQHLVAEAAAAAAVAAAIAGGPAHARSTVVVLTGANIDERRLCALLAADHD